MPKTMSSVKVHCGETLIILSLLRYWLEYIYKAKLPLFNYYFFED